MSENTKNISGFVEYVNSNGEYGFIQSSHLEDDILFYFRDAHYSPEENDEVTFEVKHHSSGDRANNIRKST